MRNVLKFARLMGRASLGPDGVGNTVPTASAQAGAPADSIAPGAPLIAAPPPHVVPSQLGRAERLKAHLDATLDQFQHARSDADQLYMIIADLEAGARLTNELAARGDQLAQALEDERLVSADLSQCNADLVREVARARDEITHAQAAAAAAQKEASAQSLARQREGDRMTALTADITALQIELQTMRETKDRLEVDCSSLRTALAERDSVVRSLQMRESEMRLRAEKDGEQIAELLKTTERKERKIVELGNAIEASARRSDDLEERYERAREEQRHAEIRHADLQVSSESRIYALTSSLSQEQAGHRVTRKLLEEMRASSQAIADQNKLMKDQSVALAQENQQMKLELSGTRGTIREYGDRLGELNLRYKAAQDDIERLEAAITEGKKDARRLKRRSAMVDELQGENASLHEKIKSLQHTLEQYRSGSGRSSDALVTLEPRRNTRLVEATGAEAAVTGGTRASPVAKLPRVT